MRRPAEAFPPGDFIRDELNARGWDQSFFSERTKLPIPVVRALLNGEKKVTPEIATAIGRAFGTSADLWLKLDLTYREWKQANNPRISRNNSLVRE
jgi:HTH-type transcriptional regulator/antitoxin HigA